MQSNNPYAAPEHFAQQETAPTYEPKLFSLSGRIGRLRLIGYNLVYTLVLMPVVMAMAPFGRGNDNLTMIATLITLLYLPFAVLGLASMVRRLHDLGQTGWLSILMLLPVVNLFFGLYLLLAPGSPGTNRYGLRPAPNLSQKKNKKLVFGLVFGIVALVLALKAFEHIHEENRLANLTPEQLKAEQQAKKEYDFQKGKIHDLVTAVQKTLNSPASMVVTSAKYSIGETREGACLQYNVENKYKTVYSGFAVMQVINRGERTRLTTDNTAHWNAVCAGEKIHDHTKIMQDVYGLINIY